MIPKSGWSEIYKKASTSAALAFKTAEQFTAAGGKCVKGTLTNGDPTCVCPICTTGHETARAIAQFDTFWRHSANEDDLPAIRQKILKDLPRITLENGTESRAEILRAPSSKDPDGQEFKKEWDNSDEFQRYLSEVLSEIEYRIDGAPPEALAVWAELTQNARSSLAPLLEAPEVTRGAASMSRRNYATEALRLLDQVDTLSAMMARAPADADGPEDQEAPGDEQTWLLECFAEIATLAFTAGWAYRAAAGKASEQIAAKKIQEVKQNREHGAKGGQEFKKKNRYAKLNELADADASKFTHVSDKQALRNAKTLARTHDQSADLTLFHSAPGKFLTDQWFREWLDAYRASKKLSI